MKYLMDTHTAIWSLSDNSRLSPAAKGIIDDTFAPLCVSIVSAWEIAIKVSLGKLAFPGSSSFFLEKMKQNGIEIIGMEGAYVKVLETLPYIHKDPFDRMIISTAIADGLTLLTADVDIQKYNVSWIW